MHMVESWVSRANGSDYLGPLVKNLTLEYILDTFAEKLKAYAQTTRPR